MCQSIIQNNYQVKHIYNLSNKNYNGYEKIVQQITEIVQKQQGNKNLVQVYHVEINKEKKCLLMVMEKCTTNLDDERMKKNNYQDFDVIEFLRQFLNGYRALYESNIIHKNIKPENILIQQIGLGKYYRLADYGLSRIDNYERYEKIQLNIFESPEFNKQIYDEELDNQYAIMKQKKQKSVADIYSLGIILHLMVTGGIPCEYGKNSRFQRNLKTQPYKINSSANQQLVDLIERMIVYDPSKRITFDVLYEEFNRLILLRDIPIQKQIGQQINIFNEITCQLRKIVQIVTLFKINPLQNFKSKFQKDLRGFYIRQMSIK